MAQKQYEEGGNIIISPEEAARFPRTRSLINNELGREVTRLLNEQFKGIRGIEDTKDYGVNEILTHSNTPRALIREQILKEIFPRAHLLTYQEILTPSIWNALEERDSTYADLNGFVLYSNPGPNEELRQRVLAIFGKETRELSQEFPLIISGLKGVRADKYPFTFEDSDTKKAEPESFLRESGKYMYVPGKGVVADERGIYVSVDSSQSGLRSLFRDWPDRLIAWFGILLDSGESGRVQVLFEPKARAEI